MARASVKIPTNIWRCPGFRSLDTYSQRLYFILYAHPSRNQAGLLPLTPNRWAQQSHEDTEAGVRECLAKLDSVGYAAVDNRSDEVVLRLLIPPAGYKNLQGAMADAALIESLRLRMFSIDRMLELNDDWQRVADSRGRISSMRMKVYTRDGFRCLHCGWAPMVPEGYDGRYALGEVTQDHATGAYRVQLLELDHVYPRSLGGPFTFDNLQTLCNTCNASKGASV